MSKFKYSKDEKQINMVLKHHDETLSQIHFPSAAEVAEMRSTAEDLLRQLGYQPDVLKGLAPVVQQKKPMVLPTWQEVCANAEKTVGTDCELISLFTEEELRSNERAIKQLNSEFNATHRLDAFDLSIIALASIIGAAVDIALVGFPQKTPEGLKAGSLSNHIREYFDKKFPESNNIKKDHSCEWSFDFTLPYGRLHSVLFQLREAQDVLCRRFL